MDIRTLPEAIALLTLLKGSKQQKNKWKNTLTEYEKKKKRKGVAIAISTKLSNDGVGRNSPCPCGSGKKYKKCHLPRIEDEAVEAETLLEELGLRIRNEEEDDTEC